MQATLSATMILNMNRYPLKKLLLLLVGTILVFASVSSAQKTTTKDEDKAEVKVYLAHLREQYEKLPDQGKFVTGAVVGFGASKMVVKSAVTFVKVAGAAFVV